jgi:hypothetical protein
MEMKEASGSLSTPTVREPNLSSTRHSRYLLLVIAIAAATLRILQWPAFHEVRDGDELGYAWGSLQLLEGNLPGIHYAPAGPQTWVGWFYEGLVTAEHLARPDNSERQAPREIRPFLAVNHSVFDSYRDTGPLRQVWIASSFLLAIAAAVAGYRLGLARAGIAGGLFLGGTVALLPLFVEFSVQARPYGAAWSLGIIALYYALASPRPQALTISAIFLGLSIASRVDMVLLLPLVWSELWLAKRDAPRWQTLVRYHVALVLSFIAAAPWYLMTLIASLRAVATIRGAGGLRVDRPVAVLFQVLWEQGLLLHVILFLFGLVLLILQRPRRWFLAIYLLIIAFSVFKGAAFGLRYQGAPIVLAIVVSVSAIAWICRTAPAIAVGLSAIALIVPAGQTARLISITKRNHVPDSATEWVESHVPPGTIVYVRPWITNLLPTPAASDAAWSEVTDSFAYARKFKSGMERFHLSEGEIPRALSEVNLALERANRRCFFILGSRQWIPEPRYDTRVFESGPVFGIRNLPAVFSETGGVVVIRGPASDPITQSLGNPTISWVNESGDGTRIFCSADVTKNLK